MKFVCDSCKAKYQISDDKVAGKSLRMKCRKCGHTIQVAAVITTGPVVGAPGAPGPVALSGEAPSAAAPSAMPPRSLAPAPRPSLPAMEVSSESMLEDEGADEGATLIAASPLHALAGKAPLAGLGATGPAAPGAAGPGRPAGPPPSGGVSRPLGLGAPSAAPRIVPPSRASLSGAPRPSAAPAAPPGRAPGASGSLPAPASTAAGPTSTRAPSALGRPAGPAPFAAAAPAGSAPFGPLGLDTPPPSGAALAAGFQRAVASVAPSAPPSAPLPAEDWYVGVAGVPLGPVQLSVVRDKASAGQVDSESLVWREGFDEWQPVKAFPALLAVVEEARSSRPSRLPPPPAPAPAPSSAFGPAPVIGTLPEAAPSLPFDLGRPAPAAPAAPSSASTPTAGPSLAGLAPLGGVPAPEPPPSLGATSPLAAPATSSPAGLSAPEAVAAGLSASAMNASASSGAVRTSTTSVPPPPPARRASMHPAALAFIAMAAVFGGVAAWAVFIREKPNATQGVAQAPPTGTQAAVEPGLHAPPPPPPTTGSTQPTDTNTPVSGTAPTTGQGGLAVGTGGVKGAGSSGTAKTAEPGATAAPIDTSGFSSLGPKGPTTGPGDGAGSGAQSQLSEGEINGVVSRNKPIITRRCWTPAYDARASNAPKNARVSASVTIGPSGSVQSVNASGASDHYPSLASCVAGSIRGWTFPPSSGSTTVNIPFVFSGQ